MSSEMAVETFAEFFRPVVRVLFDWDRMQRERWLVEMSVVADPDQVALWRVPWNVDRHGREVPYDHPEARPARVDEVDRLLLAFHPERQHHVAKLVRDFRQSRQPVQTVVPTYRIPGGGHLLLDGSHRAVGLVLSRVPFRLLACAVRGPVDADIIPELKHWQTLSVVGPRDQDGGTTHSVKATTDPRTSRPPG